MTAVTVLSLTEKFLCFVMFLQGQEVFWLCRSRKVLKVWSFKNVSQDLFLGLPLPNSLISILFADSLLPWIAILQSAVAIAGFFIPSLSVFAVLFLLHLLIVIRFRGSFNGGSDMMIFVVLTGVIIASFSSQEKIQQLGLFYIAVHGLYSYLRAGLAKIIRKDWRSGMALPVFLGHSLFTDIRKFSSWLKERPILCKATCWSVILFELGVIGIPFFTGLLGIYFISAVIFHLAIYFSFGLNRFFWVWMCAWPAILYCARIF